jgi:hypothetical protein
MIDGSAIKTRKKDEEGSSWGENTLVPVCNSNDLRVRKDGVTHDILRKENVSYIGSVEGFKRYVFECAVRKGYRRYEKTIIIDDGTAWIGNRNYFLMRSRYWIFIIWRKTSMVLGKYLFEGEAKARASAYKLCRRHSSRNFRSKGRMKQ